MSPTIEDALSVAVEAHRGQWYPAPEPEPFILHPVRVMLGVTSRTAQIVALLHDVVEDSPLTLRDLADRGFDGLILDAVDRLSRRPGESYSDYIDRVAGDDIAREVKLSDLADNLANNRALPATPDNLARIARYEHAQRVLRSVVENEWMSGPIDDRDHLIASVAGVPERLGSAARGASPDPPAPGEWTPSDVVRHLIAVELEVWHSRLAQLAAEDHPRWPWVEPGPWPGEPGASLDRLLEIHADARGSTVRSLEALDDAGWARSGTHETFGELDAAGLMILAVDHDEEHLAALQA